jgi:putative phosphoesterase
MKLMFISDIHGSSYYIEKAIEKFVEEKADYIVILGDLLYHGPRNPLPQGYDPSSVLSILNNYKQKIISVRGNCDSEVDQMVLEFPIMNDYTIIFNENRRIFATHGHLYNESNMPNIEDGDIIIHGHTHIPVTKKVNNIYILNPGSISLPKENNPNSYGVLEGNTFKIKDFNNNIIKEIQLV